MKLTKLEKEILERAFQYVNDYSAWDGKFDEYDDFLEKMQPKIEALMEKLGIGE